MLAAIFAFVVHTAPVERPILPVGTSPVVSQLAGRIAGLTEKGDFEAAKKAAKLLPHRTVRVLWDDSTVPEGLRFDFGKARDQVFSDWRRFATLVNGTVVKSEPDLRVLFVPGSDFKLEWSEDASQPRLTARIGLNAEKGGQVDPATVNNRFSFALGTYLGVAKLPLPGLVMAGATISPPAPVRPHTMEASIANQTLVVCEQIQQLVERSQPMTSGLPSVAETPSPVDLGSVFQGDVPKMNFAIKNAGTNYLAFKIIPDCSCFATTAMKVAKAGETLDVEAQMDTQQFWGTVHKTLYLFSNDAENPVREIPVSISIRPRYRILPPMKTYVADGDTVSLDAFLLVPDERPLEIKSVESQGMPAEVKVEKWSGTMADPDMGEGELPRKGHKLSIRVKDFPDGSVFASTLLIRTDDPEFPTIAYTVNVQKGIVVSPATIYLGEVGAASRTVAITVGRPGKPFRILGIECDSSHVSATAAPLVVAGETKAGEYRITVVFDGKAAKGDYQASLTIKTDDPKQPTLIVPVTATVRS
jgi:hypothetical protein